MKYIIAIFCLSACANVSAQDKTSVIALGDQDAETCSNGTCPYITKAAMAEILKRLQRAQEIQKENELLSRQLEKERAKVKPALCV